jgi:hypothetical protein
VAQEHSFPPAFPAYDAEEVFFSIFVCLPDELEYLSTRRNELTLTEMAFSTNAEIRLELIDWTKNSQLNEGVIGIQVARYKVRDKKFHANQLASFHFATSTSNCSESQIRSASWQ